MDVPGSPVHQRLRHRCERGAGRQTEHTLESSHELGALLVLQREAYGVDHMENAEFDTRHAESRERHHWHRTRRTVEQLTSNCDHY